jgi:hypothetical protein
MNAFTSRRIPLIAGIALVAAAMLCIETAAAQSSERPPDDTSRNGAFKSPAVPIPRLPPVASEGGCEPKYRNGTVGSCINHQPCRGFGVREHDGSAQCICYIKRGGCNADERCSAEEGQCVADDESTFNRSD